MGRDALPKLPRCFEDPSFEPNLLDPRLEHYPSTLQEKMGSILLTPAQDVHELSLLCALWAKWSMRLCEHARFEFACMR